MLKNDRHITFLSATPVLSGDVKRFSYDELIALGFKVSFLDLTPVVDLQAERAVSAARMDDPRFSYMRAGSMGEIEGYISSHTDDYYFLMFDRYYEVRRVYDILTRYDVSYGNINTALTDNMISPTAFSNNPITFDYRRLSPAKWKRIFYNRIYRRIHKYKPTSFVVIGGINGEEEIYKNCETREGVTKRIPLRSFDYERFLRSDTYDYGGKPYAVFLDQYVPYHPDQNLHNDRVEEKPYFEELHDIFDVIRQDYGLDIIIAAHPRGDYGKKGDVFKGCRIEYGITAELVKGASLVLAHYSNSIAFAAMAKKPVLILNLPLMHRIDFMNGFNLSYAAMLGAPVIVRGSDLHEKNDYGINEEKYGEFNEAYLESRPYDGRDFWTVVTEEIP